MVDLATDQFLVRRVGILGNSHQPFDFFPDVVFREYNNRNTTITEKVNKAVTQSSFAYAADTSKNNVKKNHHEKILYQENDVI